LDDDYVILFRVFCIRLLFPWPASVQSTQQCQYSNGGGPATLQTATHTSVMRMRCRPFNLTWHTRAILLIFYHHRLLSIALRSCAICIGHVHDTVLADQVREASLHLAHAVPPRQPHVPWGAGDIRGHGSLAPLELLALTKVTASDRCVSYVNSCMEDAHFL